MSKGVTERISEMHRRAGSPFPKRSGTALGITEGDQIVFRVNSTAPLLAKTPNLLDLAGTVEVPAAKRGVAWDEAPRSTRRARAEACR